MQATLHSGDAQTIDYTRPEADVDPGSVVVVGTIAGVDNCGGAADETGALSISGVWRVAKITEQAFAVGASVYWNATADPAGGVAETGAATATAEDVLLGIAVGEGAEDGTHVLVNLQQAEVPTS